MERVELACHTGHSINMGVGSPSKWIEAVVEKGMKAMAVTDIETVGAYGELAHYFSYTKPDLKLVYGKEMPVDESGYDIDDYGYISILVCNDIGKKNLYELIYETETKNYCLNLNQIANKHDGLLLGSGRENGILQRFLLNYKNLGYASIEEASEQEYVKNILKILDYIEIQPGCDKKLAKLLFDLANENKNIPVAVGGPFYLGSDSTRLAFEVLTGKIESDETYYQYKLHDTDSMSKLFTEVLEFDNETSYQLVVENSNRIADKCDQIYPFASVKYCPSIKNQNSILRDICEKALKRMGLYENEKYQKRLEWELNAVKYTGTEYMFLQIKDIKDRLGIEDFEIGSRGTVGTSLVAFLCGFNEVDPVKTNMCPYFFYGFNGNKEPDIDLNYSSAVQSKVHEAYKDAPGVGTVIKAGTFSSYGDLRALRKIEGSDNRNAKKRKYDVAEAMADTVYGRGQHPGGIILLPEGIDSTDVLPVYNIGTIDEPIITSGVDYHSIDHLVIKMDVLGHNAPEVIKRLADITGVDPRTISTDDTGVMNMFECPRDGLPACAGILEFSNSFVLDALKIARPKSFDDLVKLSSLMHGTDTWNENAKNLIEENGVSISDVLANRDDVFDMFISHGIAEKEAFALAEEVRKGMVSRNRARLWPEWREKLIAQGVPTWFVESCEKVKYLFPRAHSYAYVLSGWRMAWYKLHYPLQFYKVMLDVYRVDEFEPDYMMNKESLTLFYKFLQDPRSAYRDNEEHFEHENFSATCILLMDYFEHGFRFVGRPVKNRDEMIFEIMDDNTISVPIREE